MHRIARALILALVVLPSSLLAQDTLAGDWDVIVSAANQTIPLVLHLEEGEDGYTGTFDAPSQGGMAMPITRIVSEDPDFTIEFETGGPPVVFDGKRVGDKLSGTFTQAAAEGTFEGARRTGDAAEAAGGEGRR